MCDRKKKEDEINDLIFNIYAKSKMLQGEMCQMCLCHFCGKPIEGTLFDYRFVGTDYHCDSCLKDKLLFGREE